MRSLKFRAWHKDLNRYVTVLDIHFFEGGEPSLVDYRAGNSILSVVASNVVIEQYTGLKDRNGKEIYEGDIIKQLMYVLDGKECFTTWVVRWNNNEFCYDLHRISGALYGTSMLSTCESENCEVIGNIHEKPELMEGEK